jgi:hypothetical protein
MGVEGNGHHAQHQAWYYLSMETIDKARINRARRHAARQGFTLRRSRTPDPLALDFGWHVERHGEEVSRFYDLAALERWLAGEGRVIPGDR